MKFKISSGLRYYLILADFVSRVERFPLDYFSICRKFCSISMEKNLFYGLLSL